MPTLAKTTSLSQHGTWIEIRLDRLLKNLKTLKDQAGPGTGVLAVIKANAYGHGLSEIAKTLSPEVQFLGVSSLFEAMELREHGIQIPIFLFGRLLEAEIPAALTEGFVVSLSSLEEAEEIAAMSQSLGKTTPVHIKVDTGMGRLGLTAREAVMKIETMASLPGISLDGIYTHFPTAEREDGFAESQLREFSRILQELGNKGIHFRFRHASNSAASLRLKTPLVNLIRPGLMLYGIYPDPALRKIAAVHPILSLKSKIILTKRLKIGESAGYGRDFITSEPTTIAVLPIGYSHGYPFRASRQASVLYRGKRYPLAGRVSMDYLAVDFGDAPACAGDEVTLLGEDGPEKISAEDIADWAGTIPYEVVTRLISRIPRFYRS